MLNELNGLLDQNSKLVKELDYMRDVVRRFKEDPSNASIENKFTEEDVKERIMEDREAVKA